MRVLAAITDPVVVDAILAQLGLPTEPPTVAPARASPQVPSGPAPWTRPPTSTPTTPRRGAVLRLGSYVREFVASHWLARCLAGGPKYARTLTFPPGPMRPAGPTQNQRPHPTATKPRSCALCTDQTAFMRLMIIPRAMRNYTTSDLIRVRAVLVDVASRGHKITYTDLAQRAALAWKHQITRDRNLLGQLLGEVSKQEYERGRPLITAVVVYKGSGVPGPGFYVMTGGLALPKTRAFWTSELRRVHDFWAWR